MMTNEKKAAEIAARTEDAYSFSRYAPGQWHVAAAMLLRRGYSEQETEAVLRSKWTRWAADAAGADYGQAFAHMLTSFLDDPRNKITKYKVERLAAGAEAS